MEERALPAWSERVVRLLDDGARVPGTELRFGVDALLGALLPGVGDAVSGVGSFSLLVLAWREGVPTRGLARILLNVAIDTIGGSLPVIGDVFDVFFKANRRNLELIESYRDEAAPRRAAFRLPAAQPRLSARRRRHRDSIRDGRLRLVSTLALTPRE